MELREKLEMLEDLLELDEGTLNENTELNSLEEWDSVAALSLIVLLDEEFNKTITGKQVKEYKTIKDILNVMEK